MATMTRTVMNSAQHSAYITVDGKLVVPTFITRFSAGTRVEVYVDRSGNYAVIPVEGDSLRIFGEEKWHMIK